MSIKILKRYQEEAVEKLFDRSKEILKTGVNKSNDNKLIIFKSPTGSGKTFTMSRYIYKMCKDEKRLDFCFLWISIGKGGLHEQSYNAIKGEIGGFSAYLLEEEFFGTRRRIDQDETVVVSWDKLALKNKETGEWKANLMKDKETVNFRDLIKTTKEDGRKIVLIIDESQVNANAERAMEVRDIIDADLTIEVSATPILVEGEHDSRLIEVDANDVINEGMIKKEIVINENVGEFIGSEKNSQESVLEAAYKKRVDLKKMLEKEESDVNPLVLVQIPTGEEGEKKRTEIEKFLAQKDITLDNGKLAVWLSEEKVNLEILENNESEVEFLIFKQAIDTGWDCPRAHVLVRLRNTRSKVMELQTIGRIMRMPEAMHFQNDKLNKAFIYTNIIPADIDFKGNDMTIKNAIKSIFVKRSDKYKALQLKSYYRNRVDFGDLTLSFHKVFEKSICDYFDIKVGSKNIKSNETQLKKKKVDLKGKERQDEIILDKEIPAELFDKLPNEGIEIEDSAMVNLSDYDKGKLFNFLMESNLNGFAPARSMSIFHGALFKWFREYLGINRHDGGLAIIQNIVLNNLEIFDKVFNLAVKAYVPVKDDEIKKRVEEVEEWNKEWEIAENRNYPDSYKPVDYDLSLYKQPADKKAYLNLDSDVEKEFLNFLELNKTKIDWWWQNGNEHMALNFGIKYDKGGNMRERASTFQPDFLVMFKNGKLGIYDTKASGYQEDDNKIKAEALQKYIKEENKRKKKEFLLGGIVIKESRQFLINDDDIYIPFGQAGMVGQSGGKKKEKGWKFLEF